MTTPPRAARWLAFGLLVSSLLGLNACASLSVNDERKLGAELSREVKAEATFVSDPYVTDYIDDIGQAIVRAAGPQAFEYRFHVIENDEINAFAMPGGYIYIHTETILMARNVSELAGVIAHEVGHVALRHIAENYARSRTASLGHRVLVLGAGLAGGNAAAGAANVVGGLSAMAVLNSFSREA